MCPKTEPRSARPGRRVVAALAFLTLLSAVEAAAGQREPESPARPAGEAGGAVREASPPPWRVELELGVETALDDGGYDLNVFETAELGLALDGLRARHRVRARGDLSRRIAGGVALMVGVEYLFMRGGFLPAEEPAWGLEHVARGFTYRYGLQLPRGFRVYMESQDHWRFAGHEELVIDGPYEIYNMIMIGKDFSWDLDRRGSWLVDGRCEVGFNLPRNEFGLNVRRPEQESTDGFGDSYGRYALRCRDLGIARRVDAGPVRDVRLYANLFLALGRTIPQQLYSWSPRYIGHQRNLGLQARLRHDWTVFLEKQWTWAIADEEAVPGVGPFGEYLSVGVSKRFDWRF